MKGSIEAADDRPIDSFGRRGEPLGQALAGDGEAVEIEQRLQLVQHGAHSACGEEILHVMRTGRLQIDQHRRRIGEFVQALERHGNAEAAGDSGEMNDRIGRASDREQHPERILDGGRCYDTIDGQPRACECDCSPAGRLGRAQSVGVHRRNRGGPGQQHAEGFGDAGHRARGAHHRARSRSRREPRLDAIERCAIDLVATELRPETPAIGTRAEPLAIVARGQHRSGDEPDRRHARRRCAHQLRGNGLVAAADQNDCIQRLRPAHFLDVHRHEVAIHQTRGMEEDFAEGDRRKRERQATGGEHAALHRVDQLGEMAMAIVQIGSSARDADRGRCEQRRRVTHRAGE